jgi:predicted nucleic acid-binding protein
MVRGSMILDSNVWIGYFNVDDAHHKASVKLVDSIALEQIYIPEYVLIESISVLKLRASQKQSFLCLDFFMHTPNIHIMPSVLVFSKTISLFQTLHESDLSFVDASLLVLSAEYNVQTFDKKLASAIKKRQK